MKISSSILAYTTVLSYVSVTMASGYGGGQADVPAPVVDYGYQVVPVYDNNAPGYGGHKSGKGSHDKSGGKSKHGSKTKGSKKKGSKKYEVPCPPDHGQQPYEQQPQPYEQQPQQYEPVNPVPDSYPVANNNNAGNVYRRNLPVANKTYTSQPPATTTAINGGQKVVSSFAAGLALCMMFM